MILFTTSILIFPFTAFSADHLLSDLFKLAQLLLLHLVNTLQLFYVIHDFILLQGFPEEFSWNIDFILNFI